MYLKVLTPKINGQKAYRHTGKSAQAVRYLAKEATENGQEAAFFTGQREGLSGDEVQHVLDHNGKGLGQHDAKFYSLVISPSAEELALIGNDAGKLRDFTRAAMREYADNFVFADGKKMGADDVVWAATQHNARVHRGDEAAPTGRSGQPKEGLQTHVHVVVSARDAAQRTTLNPLAKAARFDRVAWAARGAVAFTARYGAVEQGPAARSVPAEKARIHGAKAPMGEAEVRRRAWRVGERVAAVNRLLPADALLDAVRVAEAGQSRGYDRVFYNRLGRIEQAAERGVPVAEPYVLLATGRQADPWAAREQEARRGVAVPAPALGHGLLHAGNRSLGEAARSLADLNRRVYTQDISGDRDRDRERGGIER